MNYVVRGPDGEEPPDRWAEALIIKDHVHAIWDRLKSET
jgi:hypothetical protein